MLGKKCVNNFAARQTKDCAKEKGLRGCYREFRGKWRGYASATGHRPGALFLVHVISGTTRLGRNYKLITNECKINFMNDETDAAGGVELPTGLAQKLKAD